MEVLVFILSVLAVILLLIDIKQIGYREDYEPSCIYSFDEEDDDDLE